MLNLQGISRNLTRLSVRGCQTTVGIRVGVRHLKAAPVGCKIRVVSELLNVEGRKLVFKVEAYWNEEKIGKGIHERFVVDRKSFLEKVRRRVEKCD